MKILWISSIAWSTNNRYPYPVRGPGAISGSLFQQSIIAGLEELGLDVDIIADYPSIGRGIFRSVGFSHNDIANDNYVTSWNIPVIGHIIKGFSIKRAVKIALKRSHYDVAIGYLIHTPYLMALKYAKKQNNDIQCVLICPDLPGMMDMSLHKKMIKRLLKSFDYKIQDRLYEFIDKFVLFTKYMAEQIPVGNKPHIVIEGVATLNDLELTPTRKEKAIMHAGTLHRNIGIENILRSMSYLDDDYQLWIFGDGELRKDIIKQSVRDKRIRYMGFIPRNQLFEYMKKASILINTRNPFDAYTKYSFPSKIFECLLSGTPFITTELPGIPDEYYQYVHLINSDAPQAIANEIQIVINQEDRLLKEKCDRAKQFIIEKKNYLAQAFRLYEFLLLTSNHDEYKDEIDAN